MYPAIGLGIEAISGGDMPFFERTWRVVGIPLYKDKTLTPYTRFGDWFPQCLIGLVLIVLILSIVRKKKRPSILDEPPFIPEDLPYRSS